MFIVRQNNQSEESIHTNNLVDIMPEHQFSNEGQALSGPFKVPSDVLKKQHFYGNSTRDLVIESSKINILKQKMSFSSNENSSTQVKEKRKPTVNKNSKPKQQVIFD